MVGLLKIGSTKIEKASEFIDFNTMFFLIEIMIIPILKSIGFFNM
ncbi:hypothetical protein [Thermosipho atlanticus]|nr:hypothetical protein [Thermosipho atlanticus]